MKDLEGDTPQMEGTNVPDLRSGPQEFVSQGTLSEEAYMRRTEEPGVPLDVNTGADIMTRLKLSSDQEQERSAGSVEAHQGW
jgi:hypothetical protein